MRPRLAVPRSLDLPIVAIALVMSSLLVFHVGTLIEEDRCLDAGGRIITFGADHICDVGGGATLPIPPVTGGEWAVMLGCWSALVVMLTWGMSRFVRGAPPPFPGSRS